MLHWHPIKELMHELTGLSVEKSAIFELASFFEDEIEKVILQSNKELKKLNDLKEIQGLYQKNRIDRDCIRNAIKNIYKEDDSYLPSNDGRKVKEKKEDIEVA